MKYIFVRDHRDAFPVDLCEALWEYVLCLAETSRKPKSSRLPEVTDSN